MQTAEGNKTEFLVMLQEQADLSGAGRLRTKQEKGAYVYQQLTQAANRSQGPVLEALQRMSADSPGAVDYRAFWIANMIWVRGDSQVVQSLAQRLDVAHVYASPEVRLELPSPGITPNAPVEENATITEASLQRIHAPEVWALGYTGQGVVIGGQDTGYAWTHPALQSKYRGWNGGMADHDYNWHDAIHSGGGVCGPNSPAPCDDGYHGTHTMGTMVGEGYDSARQPAPDRSCPWGQMDRLPQHGPGGRHSGHLRRVLPVVHCPNGPQRDEPEPGPGTGHHQQLLELPDLRRLYRSKRSADGCE